MSDLTASDLMYEVACMGVERLRLPGPWVYQRPRPRPEALEAELSELERREWLEHRKRDYDAEKKARAAADRVLEATKRERAKRRARERAKRAKWRERETRNARGGGGYYKPVLMLCESGLILGDERPRAAISIREAILEARQNDY
jgi:hypothetical protein